jgi:hypothetical protein
MDILKPCLKHKLPRHHQHRRRRFQDIYAGRPLFGPTVHQVRRFGMQCGELGLAKPDRPRGSFLLFGLTGVGNTETIIVTTDQVFGVGQLFYFDLSEF